MTAAVAAAAAAGPHAARAAEMDASAAARVAELNAALIAAMRSSASTSFRQRYEALAPVIDRVFDLPRIVRLSVGAYWGGLPAPQQARLLLVFRSFTVATYVANFNRDEGDVASVSTLIRPVGAEQVADWSGSRW